MFKKLFIFRNPKFCISNVRNLYSVRRTMKIYAANNPRCEYCSRKNKLDIHHIQSVKERPDLAGEYSNLITLCRKPSCHFIVGHMGNWHTSNPNVREICKINSK